MRHRPCPFCCSESFGVFGTREDVWVRCRSCRSVFRDITTEKFDDLHGGAFQDSHFVDANLAIQGLEPASERWEKLALPGTSMMEIGPGSGHLLAAARASGRSVTAVESSAVHRAFIHETWDIDSLYADLTAVPRGLSFDAIVAINVLEHVYDIQGFLGALQGRLAPGGVLFISTVNAASLEAALLRSWWSMCKEHDHVSFPSPAGMARVAQMIGLETERIWSAELPFEFPVSALVAARDWSGARRGCSVTANDEHPPSNPAGRASVSSKARLARFYSVSAGFDPTSRVLGALGRAATVKARLRPGEQVG